MAYEKRFGGEGVGLDVDVCARDFVDEGGFADVRVADEADGDLLLVRVQLGELAEELDERASAERVVRGGVEGDLLDVTSLSSHRCISIIHTVD